MHFYGTFSLEYSRIAIISNLRGAIETIFRNIIIYFGQERTFFVVYLDNENAHTPHTRFIEIRTRERILTERFGTRIRGGIVTSDETTVFMKFCMP